MAVGATLNGLHMMLPGKKLPVFSGFAGGKRPEDRFPFVGLRGQELALTQKGGGWKTKWGEPNHTSWGCNRLDQTTKFCFVFVLVGKGRAHIRAAFGK